MQLEPFEYPLKPEEIEQFKHLRALEAVHNEIAARLGAFRDQIFAERNAFLAEIAHKYGIKKPSTMTYDDIGKRIISIYHPDLQGHKIEDRSDAFERLASDSMLKVVRDLIQVFKATQRTV